jgi:hypothetical protein
VFTWNINVSNDDTAGPDDALAPPNPEALAEMPAADMPHAVADNPAALLDPQAVVARDRRMQTSRALRLTQVRMEHMPIGSFTRLRLREYYSSPTVQGNREFTFHT